MTIVESHGRILSKLDREAGTLLRQRFEEEGIEVRVEVQAERVEVVDTGVRVHLTSGELLEAERLLVATGPRPNDVGFGLEELGVEITPRGLVVDDRLRAAHGVWAIGDAAGVALLTHVGK